TLKLLPIGAEGIVEKIIQLGAQNLCKFHNMYWIECRTQLTLQIYLTQRNEKN
ncbi:hypothetical protein WUBG_13032, partial [Wuchereria bancrofti]